MSPTGNPAEPSPAPSGPSAPARRRIRRFVLWFFVVACGLAGLGFCMKIHHFFVDALADEGIGFAGPHLFSYALVAGGYVLLLGGMFLRGHFSDIESVKHQFLEQERRHDSEEFPGLPV